MSRSYAPAPPANPRHSPINAPSSRAFPAPGASQQRYRHPLPPQMQAYYPPSLSAPPPSSSNDHGFPVYMHTLASIIEAQPRRIMEAFAPQFDSLRAEIRSLKASFDCVQSDSSKVQHDMSKISTEISNMGEILSTVVRAQNSTGLTRPATHAESSATPLDVQMKSQGSMPSTDVEMVNTAVQHEAQAEPSSSPWTTRPYLSAPPFIPESQGADFPVSSTQRQWNVDEAPRGFSKVDWRMEVSAPSQSTPAPTRQSLTLPQRSSRTPRHPDADDINSNSSPHPFFPADSRSRSEETNEVQQLPSPPELATLSQSEEASVQKQLQSDSQFQSQLTHRHIETPTRPASLEQCRLLSSSSISSSTSSSTGLFSPISPQISAFSRGEIPKSILDLLRRREEGMPIVSLAMSELPELQYPTQPGMKEIEHEGGRNGEGEEKLNEESDNADVEKYLDEESNEPGKRSVGEEQMVIEGDERVEMTNGQGKEGIYIHFDKEEFSTRSLESEPFAMSSPPTPLAEETRHPEVKEKLQPQYSVRKKTPLFLPDSGPSSVNSMSPAPVIWNKTPVEEIGQQKNGELSQQRRQREVEEDQVSRNLIPSPDRSQRQQNSPPSSSPQSYLPPSSSPFRNESQSSLDVAKFLTELSPRKDREGSLDERHSPSPVQHKKSPSIIDVASPQSQQPYDHKDEEDGEHHVDHHQGQQANSQHRPPLTSSDEVDHVMVQLTTLSEIESSEESDDDEEGEEVDELLSSCEDNLHPDSSDGIDPETEALGSQVDSARMSLTDSQRRKEEDRESMEDVEQGSGVDPGLESQVELNKLLLLTESQRREEDTESIEDVQEESGGEPESQSQVDLVGMLIPQSQMREEVGGDEAGIMGHVREETGVEPELGTRVDSANMLITLSQMREEVEGGEEGTMGDSRQETGPESQPGTQVDLAKMLIPQSQIRGEDKGREEVGAAQQETPQDLLPSTMDGDARGDDIPMPVESSIDRFTPRMEVRDPIVSSRKMDEEEGNPFEKMEEEEELEQGQGQGQEELDRQMQVDDDGSQLQFENHHHETDHLSADLSCQNGLEKYSSSQLYDSVQPIESNLLPRNDELEPLSPPPLHDAQPDCSVELSPPPSAQVPNNHLRESGTSGGIPPSPSDSISLTTPIQMRNRTQQQRQQAGPVVPVALPEYISPVNSPSPSKSPLPILRFGRKRKLDEMLTQSLNGALGMSGGGGGSGRRKEQVKQVQLVTPTGSGREKKRMWWVAGTGVRNVSTSISPDGARNSSHIGSGSGKRMQQSSTAAVVLVTPKRSRVASAMNSKEKNKNAGAMKGEGRSEENPICLSSTPSTPTDEVGDERLLDKGKGKEREREREREREKEKEKGNPFECIDLTGSPVLTRARAVKAVEEQMRKKGKGKEKEKEDEKRKKKEKEKKMMPVGMEDSDDAEVIPARAFKAPKAAVESTSDDEHHRQQRNEKKSNGTTKVPILNLNGIRDRQNKALTKVKRKARHGGGDSAGGNVSVDGRKKVVGEDEEPPLKRARGRSDDRDTSNNVSAAAGSGSGSKGRVLRKETTGMSTARTKWPKKRDERRSDRNFVKCDKCSMWYHYGCVGISMEDDRLKDDVNFICPPCSAGGVVAWSLGTGDSQKNKSRSASRRNSTAEICARPDCAFKNSSDEFWVKRIVGRKTKVEGGRGRVEVYLVEWEGYPLGEATWQEEDTMGNPAELIADFVRATRKEGINLDRDPTRTVLLKDAQRAGWTTDD